MIVLSHDGIDTVFLHTWLIYKGIFLDKLAPCLIKRNRKFQITDNKLLECIFVDYNRFQKSKIAIDDFFDRQIIIARGNKKNFKLSIDRIVRKPIFIFQNTNKNFLFGVSLKELTSTKVIPCPLEILFDIYGLDERPRNLSLFQPKCGRTFSVLKVLKDKAFVDIDSAYATPDIPIGHNQKTFFFIPSEKLIQKRYFCRKFPDQCHYHSKYEQHRSQHESICSNETIIKSKQVNLFKIIRFK